MTSHDRAVYRLIEQLKAGKEIGHVKPKGHRRSRMRHSRHRQRRAKHQTAE